MKNIQAISREVISCERCPRLVKYRREVAATKVKRFRDWDYWGKPVPGFGDSSARLLIIGLAPAAHGANRTGRMFTGDSSGDWLYRALYDTGFANQPESSSRDDGMRLSDVYINAVCRCAPPDNKPLPAEIGNCSTFLENEMQMLRNVKVILCLGQIAFNRYCQLKALRGLEFGHEKKYTLESGTMLVSSYHPSRQNTNTGKLKWEQWVKIFKDIREMLK